MNLLFRNLRKDEIKPAIAKATEKGVSILLWKQNFVDLDILDELLESSDYEITYPQNHICRISIWDKTKKMWVSREGIGEGCSPKNTANDALKRAGMSWGIGRELFSSGELFVAKDYLSSLEGSGNSYRCYDEFKVLDIEYCEKKIKNLKLGIYHSGQLQNEVSFSFLVEEETKNEVKSTKKKSSTTSKKAESKTPTLLESEDATKNSQQELLKTSQEKAEINDNEVILLGNCRGKRYGEVKDTQLFKCFLHWAKNATPKYPDKAIEEQFLKFKNLAIKISA